MSLKEYVKCVPEYTYIFLYAQMVCEPFRKVRRRVGSYLLNYLCFSSKRAQRVRPTRMNVLDNAPTRGAIGRSLVGGMSAFPRVATRQLAVVWLRCVYYRLDALCAARCILHARRPAYRRMLTRPRLSWPICHPPANDLDLSCSSIPVLSRGCR